MAVPGERWPGVGAPRAEPPPAPELIKWYARKRFLSTTRLIYLSDDDIAELYRAGRAFTIIEARMGEDVTGFVLKRIDRRLRERGATPLFR